MEVSFNCLVIALLYCSSFLISVLEAIFVYKSSIPVENPDNSIVSGLKYIKKEVSSDDNTMIEWNVGISACVRFNYQRFDGAKLLHLGFYQKGYLNVILYGEKDNEIRSTVG